MLKFIKKYGCLLTILLLIVSFSFTYYNISLQSQANFCGVVIVLDAGHGGRDGGCVGVNGSIEKELNLKYTLSLKNKLIKHGYKVVLTRSNDDGLYSPLANDKKVSDMNARMKIIKNANPNLVVSIHMNSFRDSSVSGANCFYKIDDSASKQCASLIQTSLNTYCNAPNKNVKSGDYFMLNCSYYTSVLIECGFISNKQEEENLNNLSYMDEFTTAVCNGILLYFG